MAQIFNFKFQSNNNNTETNNNSKEVAKAPIVMTEIIFINLRELIYNICGIFFTDSKKYLLEGRVQNRITALKLNSFQEYIDLIKSINGREELNNLFDAITINETYFFRAENQFEVFEKQLIPEIIKAKKTSKIVNIWSSACSSGEEPYTLAIIIKERLKHIYKDITFNIYATDISQQIIDQAKTGLYREYSIRNIPKELLTKYFTKVGTNYQISDEIKGMVTFKLLNLYDTVSMRKMINFDLIFCCNVLIYFDMASKQRVVKQLYSSLNPNAFLFIGYSESLHGISKEFKLVHYPKVMVYQKEVKLLSN